MANFNDSIELSPAQQKAIGTAWRIAQNSSKVNNLKNKVRDTKNTYDSAAKPVKKIIARPTPLNAAFQGVKTGVQLRKRGFSGANFILILLLCAMKDLADIAGLFLDFFSVGAFSVLFNVFINFALFIIFFGNFGTKMATRLIRRYLWSYIVEYIPFINVFPFYTIMAILSWMKEKSLHEKEENEERQMESNKETNNQEAEAAYDI